MPVPVEDGVVVAAEDPDRVVVDERLRVDVRLDRVVGARRRRRDVDGDGVAVLPDPVLVREDRVLLGEDRLRPRRVLLAGVRLEKRSVRARHGVVRVDGGRRVEPVLVDDPRGAAHRRAVGGRAGARPVRDPGGVGRRVVREQPVVEDAGALAVEVAGVRREARAGAEGRRRVGAARDLDRQEGSERASDVGVVLDRRGQRARVGGADAAGVGRAGVRVREREDGAVRVVVGEDHRAGAERAAGVAGGREEGGVDHADGRPGEAGDDHDDQELAETPSARTHRRAPSDLRRRCSRGGGAREQRAG